MNWNFFLLLVSFLVVTPLSGASAHLCNGYSKKAGQVQVPPRPKIVILSGTDRAGSNTLKVAKIAQNELEALGGDVTVIDLSQLPKNTFTGGYGNPPPGFSRFQAPISAAQALVVLTPEYNGSLPGALKYFIDLLNPKSFSEKPVTVIGLADGWQGATRATDELRLVLQHLHANVYGYTTNLPQIGKMLESGNGFGRMFSQLAGFKTGVDQSFTTSLQPTVLSTQKALEVAKRSQKLYTIEYNSGLHVSGLLTTFTANDSKSSVDYLRFTGPTQLAVNGVELSGQGVAQHSQGFGAPVGELQSIGNQTPSKSLDDFSDEELGRFGIRINEAVPIQFKSGVKVSGKVISVTRSAQNKVVLVSFADCTVTNGSGTVLFDPNWGTYDMAVGTTIINVQPGAAHAKLYLGL